MVSVRSSAATRWEVTPPALRVSAILSGKAARGSPARSGSFGYNQTATRRCPSSKISARESEGSSGPVRALTPNSSVRSPCGHATVAR